MNLSELGLPGIKLPNSPNDFLYEKRRNELSNLSENNYEIKNLLKDMKENEHRTTNFATILYLEENNFDKISMDIIINRLKKDFNINKYTFVNSRNNTPFDSERNLIQSLHASIARNKAFITDKINNKKYISLNKPKALEYLRKMYGKYINNYNGDVTSMASLDSKKSKIDFDTFNSNIKRSEKTRKSKNLIGNKTLRSHNSFNYDDINDVITVNEEDKIYSNIKYLKDNLQEKKPRSTNNSKNGRSGKKSVIRDNSTKKIDTKITPKKNNNDDDRMSLVEEINKNLDVLNGTETFITSYINKLNEIKSNVEEKERKKKEFEDMKIKINSAKKELNSINDIISIKLNIIKCTKKSRYFGNIFEKSKQTTCNYQNIFDNKIDGITKNFANMKTIEADVFKMFKEMKEKIQGINDTNKDYNYLVKTEIKKDVSNLLKKLKNENKIINNFFDFQEFYNNNNDIEEIKAKFNNIIMEINQEKEVFE